MWGMEILLSLNYELYGKSNQTVKYSSLKIETIQQNFTMK